MQSSTRIVFNTGILYSKMFVTIVIALFSTRLILDALGVKDFGIFALVGGVIGALSFLNKAMGSATQRFLSYNRGKGTAQLSKVFNTALVLHVFIGFVFVLVLEVAGVFLFDGFLNIDPDRIPVAKFVFHCTVASTFFSVIAVPYDAIMNAKENMIVFSLFSILEAVLKLVIAIFLYYTPADRLATYGLCMALMTVSCRTLKRIYSRLHYPESKLNLKAVDGKLMKEMGAYSGWVTVEIASHIAKGDGIPILLNLFFGTGVNAAYGVSTQVRHNISFFSEMIFKSSNPQVMKNIGDGNLAKSVSMSMTVCKFSFLLMALLSVPLIVDAPYVLSLWLKKVPDNAVEFCQLVLGTNLLIMTARGLNFLIDGIGKIRNYRLILSVLNLLVFPIAYVLLKFGFSPYSVFVGIFLSDFLVVCSRIYFASKHSGMSAWKFCKDVPFRVIPLTFFVGALTWLLRGSLPIHPFAELLLLVIVSSALFFAGFWLFVMDAGEKSFVKEKWGRICQKWRKRRGK